MKTKQMHLKHEQSSSGYLLVVLDAHADGVDQDGDHDASVEVLALHDPPQLRPDAVPQLLASLLWTAPPVALLLLTAVRFLHRSLLRFVFPRAASRSHAVGERQGGGTLRAAGGGAEGRGRGVVGFIPVGTGWT